MNDSANPIVVTRMTVQVVWLMIVGFPSVGILSPSQMQSAAPPNPSPRMIAPKIEKYTKTEVTLFTGREATEARFKALTGPRGAAQVYGPQKGATPEMVSTRPPAW